MSLEATAQVIEVTDENALMMPEGAVMQFKPLHGHGEHDDHGSDIVVNDPEPQVVVEISFDTPMPGAPSEAAFREPEVIEVHEDNDEDKKKDVSDTDDNEAKMKAKKNEKWNWSAKGPTGFLDWVKERFQGVPKHSGYDSAGLERACAYLERLDSEISKAMRLDVDGELDSNKIEEVRVKIEDGISKLNDRLDTIRDNTKKKRKKKSDVNEDDTGLIKQATAQFNVNVDLLTSRIARVCINGMVSAGHDIEKIYESQVKKYKLNDREQAMVMQLLADMGYPLRQDRGYLLDEDVNTSSSDGFDWATNYRG